MPRREFADRHIRIIPTFLAVGALSPEAVAVEVRRAGETTSRPQLGLVTAEGRIAYPADTRPLPTVDAYDTLLTGGTPT